MPVDAPRNVPDLSGPRRVHVVAAGGTGMSALATVLVEAGHRVTGSDAVDSAALRRLAELGVTTFVGHDATHVGDAEFVVASTAVPTDNPEIVEARRRGLDVLRRLDLLPALARRQPFVSVSGTHGKTTTSALLAVALTGAGAAPSFLVGAPVASLGTAAGFRDGQWFVLEADESDASFLAGPRAAAVVTNIEPDHLEFWGGWDELLAGFRTFLAETDGPCLVCADDPEARSLGASVGAASYGEAADATHRVAHLVLGPDRSTFDLLSATGAAVHVDVPLAGRHNALNVAGALSVVRELGADVDAAAAALADFAGVARRFELVGSAAGVTVIDDYAHLPAEVAAVLAAGRSGGWDRVVAVFQPHRYSRTERHAAEFGPSFGDADVLVLCELYPAGEAPRPGVDGSLVLESVAAAGRNDIVVWRPTLDEVVGFLVDELRSGDLLLTIGAGDVTTVGPRVLEGLRGRSS